MKTVGIIGAGQIGSAIARALSKSSIEATIANSRGPESLRDLLSEVGPIVTGGTVEQAAAKDIVFVAVNWSRLPGLFNGLPDFGGRILVDANNPIEAPLFKPVELGNVVSSEVVAGLARGAHLVKAFNHLQPNLLSGDPQHEGGKRVLFYSGDDADSKTEIGALIDRLGFYGIDLGSLAVGGRLVQFPGGPLPSLNLVKFG